VSIEEEDGTSERPTKMKEEEGKIYATGEYIRKQDRERAFDRTLSRRSTAARLVLFLKKKKFVGHLFLFFFVSAVKKKRTFSDSVGSP
jgi:hypothetical protein